MRVNVWKEDRNLSVVKSDVGLLKKLEPDTKNMQTFN
jgi:hypothetical protein